MIIKLPGGPYAVWPDKPLGKPGGFGEVFEGANEDNAPLAMKRLHLDAGHSAGRELRISSVLMVRTLGHVMPVIDAGQDADSDRYYIVMPRASGDLQHWVESKGVLAAQDAARILIQIAKGLKEVESIVHRDLKPGNILFHEGHWKVADFGIARFVEESTSLQTLRDCLTQDYAAPEQFQGGQATGATDIYALGGIGIFILTGKPPFHNAPEAPQRFGIPNFVCDDDRLRGLIGMMLRVGQQTRPSVNSVIASLERIAAAKPRAGSALSGLAAAGAEVAAKESAALAIAAEEQRKYSERSNAAGAALFEIRHIFERLSAEVRGAASAAVFRQIDLEMASVIITLGKAKLTLIGFSAGIPLPPTHFPISGWDILGHGNLKFEQSDPGITWGASFWFGRTDVSPDYRWYEVGYCSPKHRGMQRMYMPRVAASYEEADRARRHSSLDCSVAYGPYAIDGDMEADFRARMISLIGLGALGKLSTLQDHQMPFGEWPYSIG